MMCRFTQIVEICNVLVFHLTSHNRVYCTLGIVLHPTVIHLNTRTVVLISVRVGTTGKILVSAQNCMNRGGNVRGECIELAHDCVELTRLISTESLQILDVFLVLLGEGGALEVRDLLVSSLPVLQSGINLIKFSRYIEITSEGTAKPAIPQLQPRPVVRSGSHSPLFRCRLP
jgi:hypothetical protein